MQKAKSTETKYFVMITLTLGHFSYGKFFFTLLKKIYQVKTGYLLSQETTYSHLYVCWLHRVQLAALLIPLDLYWGSHLWSYSLLMSLFTGELGWALEKLKLG